MIHQAPSGEFDTAAPNDGVPAAPVRSLLPDPGLLWQIFRRNLLLFVGVAAAVLALVAIWTLTRERQYQATASILIQPAPQPLKTSQPVQPQHSTDADAIETEIRMMQSPALAERAAAAYAARYASADGDAWTKEERAGLAADMLDAISVSRDGGTFVIDVTATAPDPAFAAATANLMAEQYLQAQLDMKTGTASVSDAWLKTRLAELERNAVQTQAAVDNYKVRNGLVSANGATIAEQEVSTLNQQLAEARADLAEKRGRLAAARAQLTRGGGGADVGAALGSGTIGSLREQEAATSAELAQLTVRYGPLHPQRQQIEGRLRDIRLNIQQEIDRVLSSLEAEVRTSESRVASLSGSRGAAAGALSANGRAQAGLSELEQKALAAKSIFESFLERWRENSALAGSQQPDARLAVRAGVPEYPVSPDFRLAAMLGVIGALALGLLAIGIKEYLRRGLQTKRDIERRVGLRYAGAVPTLKSSLGKLRVTEPPHDYVVSHPQSLFAESFRSIRTFLMLSVGTRSRAIAVTSALPQEGKTTTSVCLARTSAIEGLRTILVDLDLRRRGSSALLRITQDIDLYDYLDGSAPLDSAIFIDEASGLHVLGLAETQKDGRNPMTEARLRSMLTELRARYDVIILDTAPILGVAETRLIAMLADRVLLLTRWKKTSLRAVEAVVDMLVDAGAKITGLAFTQVDITRYASTGDGDVYGYTKVFRGYYTN